MSHHVCFSMTLSCSGCNPCSACRVVIEENILRPAMSAAKMSLDQSFRFLKAYEAEWQSLARQMLEDPKIAEMALDLERVIIKGLNDGEVQGEVVEAPPPGSSSKQLELPIEDVQPPVQSQQPEVIPQVVLPGMPAMDPRVLMAVLAAAEKAMLEAQARIQGGEIQPAPEEAPSDQTDMDPEATQGFEVVADLKPELVVEPLAVEEVKPEPLPLPPPTATRSTRDLSVSVRDRGGDRERIPSLTKAMDAEEIAAAAIIVDVDAGAITSGVPGDIMDPEALNGADPMNGVSVDPD